MLKVDKLSFAYHSKAWPVLHNVTLDMELGHVYGMLGKNGVGKTTLLMLMSGLLTPTSGEIDFDGENVRRRNTSVMREIFFVPEEVELPSMQLSEFVKINSCFYPRFSREDMGRYQSLFGIEENMELGRLSMGQKKKVMLSFAMATNTALLLLDEPTNGLDISSKEAFRKGISGCVSDERAIVISTHQIHDINTMLDDVMILDDNRVIFNHSLSEISRRLSFMVTDRRDLIKEALFTAPAIGGMAVVLPNDFDEETDVDMEMLFNLAVHNPGVLEYIFSKKIES